MLTPPYSLDPTAVQKERGPSKSNELKKEIKQSLACEISKKKQQKMADFEMKEATKEQFDLNNKLPLGEIKNYTTGKHFFFVSLVAEHLSNGVLNCVINHITNLTDIFFLPSKDSIQNQIPNLFQQSLDYDLFAQSKLLWSYPFYSFNSTALHPFDLDSKLPSSLNYYQIKYLTELGAIIKLAQSTSKL